MSYASLDHLSYSAVESYLRCSRKYKYRYIDQAPEGAPTPGLLFGRAFHETIEEKLRRDLSVKFLPDIWQQTWARTLESPDAGEIQWNNDTPEGLAETGARMFAHKPTQQELAKVIPLGEMIEQRFEMIVPGVPIPIIGYIDVVTADGPIDFKTAGKKWNQGQADQSLQPTLYLAALNKLGFKEWTFRYLIFTKTKTPAVQVLETKRDMADVLRAYNIVRHVWGGIQAGVYIPFAVNAWECTESFCGYWSRCQAGLFE